MSYGFSMETLLRELCASDIPRIVAKDGGAAWHGGSGKWNLYLAEHREGSRHVLLAETPWAIVGYASLVSKSQHPPFRDAGIPGIQDLAVAEQHRRLGVGTRLIRALEVAARSRGYSQVGIGFGLYRDYGAAQRLYIRLGYIPEVAASSITTIP